MDAECARFPNFCFRTELRDIVGRNAQARERKAGIGFIHVQKDGILVPESGIRHNGIAQNNFAVLGGM